MDLITSYRISQIITPASTGDMVDLATFKDDLGITDTTNDAYLGRTISRCSQIASTYCNRVFGATTYQDTFRLEQPGRTGWALSGGRNPLSLAQSPLIAITSIITITPDGTTTTLVQGVDFEVDINTSLIYRLDQYQQPRIWAPLQTQVVYQAGYLLPAQAAASFPSNTIPLPLDLEDAVGRMVSSRWFERQHDPYLKSEETAGIRTEYWIPTKDSSIPADVAGILDLYRIPAVG